MTQRIVDGEMENTASGRSTGGGHQLRPGRAYVSALGGQDKIKGGSGNRRRCSSLPAISDRRNRPAPLPLRIRDCAK
jgi:hypothetical protein